MIKNSSPKREIAVSAKTINDYFVSKVINWVLKDKVDSGQKSSFKWSERDKKVLRQNLLELAGSTNLNKIANNKSQRFIDSIIENGLNSDDVVMFQRYKDRLPLRALGLAYGLEDFDVGTAKLVSKKSIAAGYYMLEIVVKTKKYSSQLPIDIYIEDAASSKKAEVMSKFSMTAKSDVLAKRLIMLDHDSEISIAGGSVWNAQDIKYLKIAKLTKNFFVSRVLKKIGKPYTIDGYEHINKHEFNKLWEQYQLVVNGNNDPAERYKKFVSQQESKMIPSQKRQMSNLLKWMISR